MTAAAPLVGQPITRIDGRLKVTGKADYAADYQFPNLAWGVVVKSTIAKGTLTALDTSAAEKVPGVIKIYTRQNRPAIYLPKGDQKNGMITSEPLLPLNDDVIHYYGQDMAFVVANSYEEAREAAGLVRASYAVETPVGDLDGATPTAPKQVNGEKPHLEKKSSGVASVEQSWEQSPVKVDATYRTPFMHHHPMEPHAAVARWEDDGRLTFYTPTQWMYGTRNFMAHGLGIGEDRVRVLSHYLGGGFGCKGSSWMYMLLTAAAARELKRPVKFVMEREHMFTSVGYRPTTLQRLQLGAQNDGTLVAIRHANISGGSHVGDFNEPAAHAASSVLYASPNIEIDQQVAALDLNAGTFMRAPGESPGIYALESAMDELAVALNIDPVALRLKNFAANHPFTDLPFSSKHLDEAYRTAGEAFGWSKRPAAQTARDGDWLVGWGMATASYPAHRSQATARARILADGTAQISCATQDLGTGMWTIVGQTAADAFGLPLDKVKVEIGDSNLPEGPVSGGSSSTASVLPAIQAAARAAVARLTDLAVKDAHSPLHGMKAEELSPIDGKLQSSADPTRSDSYVAILQRAGQGAVDATQSAQPSGEEKQPASENLKDKLTPKKHAYQSFGAFFVEVKVHRLTCETRVSRVVAAMDIGLPVNLKTARSQVIGGAIFSIGAALTEHSVLDPATARWITQDLGTYHIPVCADVPKIDVHFVGPPDYQFNPIGARGVGEIGNTGLAAAIGNAVWHATGARIRELPITPERIMTAMGPAPTA